MKQNKLVVDKSKKRTLYKLNKGGKMMWFLGIIILKVLTIGEKKGEKIQMVKSNKEEVIMKVNITELEITEEKGFHKFSIKGGAYLKKVGKPQIPIISKLIAIPKGSEVEVKYEVEEVSYLTGYKIIPAQEPKEKKVKQFKYDEKFYEKDEFYPDEVVKLSKIHNLRGVEFVKVTVFPLSYNPAQKRVKICKKIKIKMKFKGGEKFYEVEKDLEKVLKKLLINYEEVGYVGKQELPKYLIVTPDEYVSVLQEEFIPWYKKKGVEVEVIKLSEVGGNEPEDIKGAIQEYYNTHKPKWVFLVDDNNFKIPAKEKSYDPSFTSWYAFLEGEDDEVAMDVGIGRLQVKGEEDLRNQLKKIVKYERNPEIGEWLNRCMLNSHTGEYRKVKRKIYHYNYTYFNPTKDSFFLGTSISNEEITNLINLGVNIINYRGHGNHDRWTDFIQNDGWGKDPNHRPEVLTNQDKTPVVFNICCLVNDIRRFNECFGRRFMEKYPGGAVASFGAPITSMRNENNLRDEAIFWMLYGYDTTGVELIWDIGWITSLVGIYTYTYGNVVERSEAEDNIWIYFLLGDPGLEPWRGIPTEVEVEYPKNIPVGESVVKVKVTKENSPVEGVLVCIMGGNIYIRGYTNNEGEVEFQVNTTEEQEIDLTVSGHNFLPYEGKIEVKGSRGIVYISHTIEDENGDGKVNPNEEVELYTRIKNYSNIDYTNVVGELIIKNPHVNLIVNTSGFGDIQAEEEKVNEVPFKLKTAEEMEEGEVILCSLKITSGDSVFYSEFELPVIGIPEIEVVPTEVEFIYHLMRRKGRIVDTIQYDDGTPDERIYISSDYHYGVRFTPEEKCSVLSGIFYIDNRFGDVIMYVYDDNNGRPGTLIEADTLTPGNNPSWYEVSLKTPYYEEDEFWICLGRNYSFYIYDDSEGGVNSYYATSLEGEWENIQNRGKNDLLIRAKVVYSTQTGDSTKIWVKNKGTGKLKIDEVKTKLGSEWVIGVVCEKKEIEIEDSGRIWVKIDTTGLDKDFLYLDTILISSNAYNNKLVKVPVKVLISTQTLYKIGGKVTYYSNSSPLSGVKITIYPEEEIKITDGNGEYLFPTIEGNKDYKLVPSYSTSLHHKEITAYDGALVFRHYLEKEKLEGLQLVAGDVSGDGELTSYDAGLILNYSIEKIEEFPKGEWGWDPESIWIENINEDKLEENFIAVLYGEVSGNWGETKGKKGDTVEIVIKDTAGSNGDTVGVPLHVKNLPQIIAGNVEIKYDTSKIKAVKAKRGELVCEEGGFNYNVKEEEIKIGFYCGEKIEGEGELLSVIFVIKEETKIGDSSWVWVDRFMVDEEELPIKMKKGVVRVKEKGVEGGKVFVHKIDIQSPSVKEMVVVYTTPKGGKFKMKVYNIVGELVGVREVFVKAGVHRIKWTPPASGVYFCKITTERGEFLVKTIILK